MTFEPDDDVLKSAKVVVRAIDGKLERHHDFAKCTVSKSTHGMLVVTHGDDAREAWFAMSTVLRVEIER